MDLIVKTTGYEKMVVISYSESTTSAFVLGSEKPEYLARIKLLIAIGPIVYIHNMDNWFIKYISPFMGTIKVS